MHQVDTPTLEYAKKLYPDIVGWEPLLHAEDGRPHFNTTKFSRANGTCVSVISIKPVYYEALGGFWRPISEITRYHGNKRIELNTSWRMATPRFIDWLSKRQSLLGNQLLLPTPFGNAVYQDLARPTLNIGLTTTTVYPDPNPETTTVDGGVVTNLANPGETWATIQGRATGTGVTESAANGFDVYIIHATTSNQFRYLGRAFFLYDTSSIPDSDSISSATLSIYSSNIDNAPTQTYALVASNPASNTTLTTADFDAISSTLLASEIAGASITINQYTNFALNGDGLSNISKTGVSKFGLRLKSDNDNTAPTWVSGNAAGWLTHYADTTGTTQDPKLVIEHTAGGATFTPRVTWFM